MNLVYIPLLLKDQQQQILILGSMLRFVLGIIASELETEFRSPLESGAHSFLIHFHKS